MPAYDRRAFHADEYKIMKDRRYSLMDNVSKTIQYILGGNAAVYAWIFTHPIVVWWSLFIPPTLTIFGAALTLVILKRISSVDKYLWSLEFYLDDCGRTLPYSGWEEFRSLDRSAGSWRLPIIALFVLLLGATLVPVVLTALGVGMGISHVSTPFL